MRRERQSELVFSRRGGARAGAGRKRSGTRTRIAHVRRPEHAGRHPLHVTVPLADGLPSLRGDAAHRVVRRVLCDGKENFGLRIVEYSAQRDHIHLVCEAEDQHALTQGMRSLGVRLAFALNRLWRRKGALVGDRYHARALRTPRDVRNVLAYVLRNARKHGERFLGLVDPCSSGSTFDGWKELVVRCASPLSRARTWLLAVGWKRHGPISARVTHPA